MSKSTAQKDPSAQGSAEHKQAFIHNRHCHYICAYGDDVYTNARCAGRRIRANR